jgi:hypothetical protein
MSNLLQVEPLALPSSSFLQIQHFCDLSITVLVQQPIDFRDHFRLCFANQRNRQWLGES